MAQYDVFKSNIMKWVAAGHANELWSVVGYQALPVSAFALFQGLLPVCVANVYSFSGHGWECSAEALWQGGKLVRSCLSPGDDAIFKTRAKLKGMRVFVVPGVCRASPTIWRRPSSATLHLVLALGTWRAWHIVFG